MRSANNQTGSKRANEWAKGKASSRRQKSLQIESLRKSGMRINCQAGAIGFSKSLQARDFSGAHMNKGGITIAPKRGKSGGGLLHRFKPPEFSTWYHA
jgi:hypothetical protein